MTANAHCVSYSTPTQTQSRAHSPDPAHAGEESKAFQGHIADAVGAGARVRDGLAVGAVPATGEHLIDHQRAEAPGKGRDVVRPARCACA